MIEVPQMLVVFVVVLLIFLVSREIMCWYWKQTEIVELLKDIKHLIEQQPVKTNTPKEPNPMTATLKDA